MKPAADGLVAAIRAAEEVRLRPWWLGEFNEFHPWAKQEWERRRVVETTLNEIIPRYAIARYPARLLGYDHDARGFPVLWRVSVFDLQRVKQVDDPRASTYRYTYRMFARLDPVNWTSAEPAFIRDPAVNKPPDFQRVVRTLVACTPEKGLMFRRFSRGLASNSS